ncbi:MAG: glycerol-3-phosphate 1-O-acyltransferase PlsY [Tissierellia bacterium]|nr:glycerol-3-phosphate 1-O-acyltransferase PlsY [Tissierellia bacterium]
MKVVITILLSYLLGCFSSAYVLGKLTKNIDIREYGSGNAGATNALRVLGKKLGALTFLLDILKGILAVVIGKYLLGLDGGLLASIFVVLGHNFPVFLNFKGGKGVATSLGVLMILNWKIGLVCLIVGVTVIILTRYVSLGSILASITGPIATIILLDNVDKNFYYTIWFLGLLSIIRHKSNIQRLLRGEENRLGKNIGR